MKVALISPFSLMREIPNTKYHLVLAHLLQDQDYLDFYREVEGYKILDNGAAEGSLVDNEELIAMAYKIKANEIIIPDSMGNYKETKILTKNFKNIAKANKRFKYTAVLQGSTMGEICQSYLDVGTTKWVDNIALPRFMQHIDHYERVWWASTIKNNFKSSREIHCLGATSWTSEIGVLASQNCARGLDTSMPIVLGLAGIRLSESIDYVPRAMDYFHIEASNEQKEVIHDNINTYLNWAKAS